jgi:hypothetical protein
MENQIPPSQLPLPGNITPEELAMLKERARQQAILQAQSKMQKPAPSQQPRVVYVSKRLTVAELLILFVISCGVGYGLQQAWIFAVDVLPKIEVKVK